jgi:hypothetical protein
VLLRKPLCREQQWWCVCDERQRACAMQKVQVLVCVEQAPVGAWRDFGSLRCSKVKPSLTASTRQISSTLMIRSRSLDSRRSNFERGIRA